MGIQGTILVVDDEVRSQEALRRVLNQDFEVLCAGNTVDAEKLLEGEIVHAVICDQRMPQESASASSSGCARCGPILSG